MEALTLNIFEIASSGYGFAPVAALLVFVGFVLWMISGNDDDNNNGGSGAAS